MKTFFNYSGNKNYFISLAFIFISITSRAQIIYTDLIPDSVVSTNGGTYQLDLNNDGTIDFTLNLSKSTVSNTHCSGTRTRYSVTVTPASTSLNAVANNSYAGVNFPYPINSDSIINDTSFIWVNSSNQNLVSESWTCTGAKPRYVWHAAFTGKWIGGTDKYLGLKFKVGSNTYFGWVRLKAGSTISVKDYAYNSVPDQLIYAGQSTTEFLAVSPITNSPFCAGDSLNIGFTVYGNFDSTNVFTAQLSDSAGSFVNPVAIGSLPDNFSGTISAIIPPGTVYSLLYRVRVVASSPVGISNFNNSNIIVNASLPAKHITTIDSAGICDGDSARLTSIYQLGYTYQWSLDSLNITNATSYYYYAKNEGNYRCMITNGCGSILSDSLIINFFPTPVPIIHSSGALWVCPGHSVNLYIDSLPGMTIAWYRNNIYSGNLSYYNASLTGAYYVKITNSFGCLNTSLSYSVTNSNPAARIVAGGPTSFCPGDSVLLSQTTYVDTSFTFQWYRSGNVIPGALSSTYYAKQSGSYKIVVTIPNGNCDSVSNVIDVVAVCSGINESIPSNSHFILGPNPTDHFLEIKRVSEKPAIIQIVNYLGQVFYSNKINSSQKLIDISAFSEGVYFIKWIEENYSESKQFTIVK